MAVCALIGAAVMAAVDEIVFHQLLNWHHFYDRSTTGVGLFSDGLLHTAELLALIAGFFLYADLRRRRTLAVRGAALLWVGAAHAVLAKSLYAARPPGTAFAAGDLHTGARLMYYSGDLVDIALAVTLAVQWYTATGRAHARSQRRPCRQRKPSSPEAA